MSTSFSRGGSNSNRTAKTDSRHSPEINAPRPDGYVAGAGAFGQKHLDAIKVIDGIEIVSLVGREVERTQKIAALYGIPHVTTNLSDALSQSGVDAAILCTPTPMHAEQAQLCMKMGKHVQVEIPLADNWQDAQAVSLVQQQTGLICMVGHTRRFSPSHQWIHQRIHRKELKILQMDVQTYFFRRTNINVLGQPRSWTDHLLWHHAAHTVDLFRYQVGEEVVVTNAIEGPHHPILKIAMDLAIHLKSASGVLCTLSLSFNNEGPQGTFFRYIGDSGTYIARYDELFTGKGATVDLTAVAVSNNAIELQDREFFAAIRECREPNSSVSQVLPCYETLQRLEEQLLRLT